MGLQTPKVHELQVIFMWPPLQTSHYEFESWSIAMIQLTWWSDFMLLKYLDRGSKYMELFGPQGFWGGSNTSILLWSTWTGRVSSIWTGEGELLFYLFVVVVGGGGAFFRDRSTSSLELSAIPYPSVSCPSPFALALLLVLETQSASTPVPGATHADCTLLRLWDTEIN